MSERIKLVLSALLVLGLVIHVTIGQDATTGAAGTTAPPTTPAPGTTPAPATNSTPPGGGNGTQPGNGHGSNATHPSASSPKDDGPDESVDYCVPSMCPPGHHHVACNVSVTMRPSCALDADTVDITEKLRNFLLKTLNELRNKVAKGGFSGLTPAARMASVRWDPDLAYLAEFNVRKCYMTHDDCRSTKKFPNAGQAVAYRGFKGKVPDLEDIIKDCFGMWMKQNLHAHMADVLKYKGHKIGPPIYNFLQLMVDHSDHLGCAILQQTYNGWRQTYLTCNFASAPIQGKHVFATSGTAGTGCQTGKHPTYAHLCSEKETYAKEDPKADFTYLRAEDEPDTLLQSWIYDDSDNQDDLEYIHHGIHIIMPDHEEFEFLQAADGTTAAAGGTTAAPAAGGTTAAPAAGGTTAAPAAGGTTAAPATGGTTAAPAGNITAAGGNNTTGGGGATQATGEDENTEAEALAEPTTAAPDLSALQRKFARFIFLMDLAETRSSHRNYVITTSNHAVKDNHHMNSTKKSKKAARSRMNI
ncbi:uncharacterized protein [Drosophila bipectinata]|uniref:uncharacterized protein n=1 Tax=Drosophila bipectinata TaxID=42026 RepID=UPI001C89C444|nr:uncharacterized protein LOC108127853 [Drosophila bipectinata]